MGAVALSQTDEATLELLQKTLGLPSKSQVIHRALQELRGAVARERLGREIKQSVQKCDQADRKEHEIFTGAAIHRLAKE